VRSWQQFDFFFKGVARPVSSFDCIARIWDAAILLGLEFLVAGDIIRTVVVDPTFNNVLVLGLIVLIRTFLSMSLQLELEGRWPLQHDPPKVKNQGEVSSANVRDE